MIRTIFNNSVGIALTSLTLFGLSSCEKFENTSRCYKISDTVVREKILNYIKDKKKRNFPDNSFWDDLSKDLKITSIREVNTESPRSYTIHVTIDLGYLKERHATIYADCEIAWGR